MENLPPQEQMDSCICYQSGHLQNYIDRQQLHKLLINKINVLDFKSTKDDVGPFLKSSDNLEIWSPEYFIALVEKMKIA